MLPTPGHDKLVSVDYISGEGEGRCTASLGRAKFVSV